MNTTSVLSVVLSVWAMITIVWIVLLVYRGLIGRKEEDQVFLSSGEVQLMKKQREITSRLKRISPYVNWTGIVSLLLLLAVVAVWLDRGIRVVN